MMAGKIAREKEKWLMNHGKFRAVRLKKGSLRNTRLYDGFVRFGKHRAKVGRLSVVSY
jgi:hypothetical protein